MMEVVVTNGAKLQLNHHHQQTNTQYMLLHFGFGLPTLSWKVAIKQVYCFVESH